MSTRGSFDLGWLTLGNRPLIKVVNTYILEHQGENGHPEVCRQQRDFFQEKGILFKSLEWPTGAGSSFSAGEDYIDTVKSKFDFSTLEEPFVSLNGRGELHGRTFFFVDGVGKDLTYYQMDAHLDVEFPYDEGIVGCGDHVHYTMQLDHVKKINLLGLNPFLLTDGLGYFMGDEEGGYFEFAPVPAIHDPKVELYLGEKWSDSKMRVSRESFYDTGYRIELLEKYGGKFLVGDKEFLPDKDPAQNAYISIDLDVIRGFPTGWHRAGVWTIDKVINTINEIGRVKQIIGADICGLCLYNFPERPLTSDRKKQALEDIVKIHKTLCDNMS